MFSIDHFYFKKIIDFDTIRKSKKTPINNALNISKGLLNQKSLDESITNPVKQVLLKSEKSKKQVKRSVSNSSARKKTNGVS